MASNVGIQTKSFPIYLKLFFKINNFCLFYCCGPSASPFSRWLMTIHPIILYNVYEHMKRKGGYVHAILSEQKQTRYDFILTSYIRLTIHRFVKCWMLRLESFHLHSRQSKCKYFELLHELIWFYDVTKAINIPYTSQCVSINMRSFLQPIKTVEFKFVFVIKEIISARYPKVMEANTWF